MTWPIKKLGPLDLINKSTFDILARELRKRGIPVSVSWNKQPSQYKLYTVNFILTLLIKIIPAKIFHLENGLKRKGMKIVSFNRVAYRRNLDLRKELPQEFWPVAIINKKNRFLSIWLFESLLILNNHPWFDKIPVFNIVLRSYDNLNLKTESLKKIYENLATPWLKPMSIIETSIYTVPGKRVIKNLKAGKYYDKIPKFYISYSKLRDKSFIRLLKNNRFIWFDNVQTLENLNPVLSRFSKYF